MTNEIRDETENPVKKEILENWKSKWADWKPVAIGLLKSAWRVTAAAIRIFSRVLYILYPTIVLLTVSILFPRFASAGEIRKLALSQDRPGVVNLAFGNATAISFQFKPEKLVPGSPHKVEINFLGKDITVSPLATNPGNLLVFTDRGLYVLLFRIVPESRYDDRVEVVAPGARQTRAIQVTNDSYHVERVSVSATPANKKERVKEFAFDALVYSDRLTGDEFMEFLSFQKRLVCDGCFLNRGTPGRALVCRKPLPERFSCQSEAYRKIEIGRKSP